MTFKELKEKLEEAKFKLDKATTLRVKVPQAREALRNVLENNLADIIAAVESAANAQKKIEAIEAALDASDAELDTVEKENAELKAHIAELEEGAPKKKKAVKPEPDAGNDGAGDDAGEQ